MTTIIELLEEDHQQVKSLLDDIKSTGDDAVRSRRDKFKQIQEALEIHTRFEEEKFYPRARALTGMDEEVDDDLEEHDEAKRMLDEISETDPGDAEWMEMIEELDEALRHHISDEEEQLFPATRQAMETEEAETLGKEYARMKKRASAQAAE